MEPNNLYTSAKDAIRAVRSHGRSIIAPAVAALALSAGSANAQDQAGYVCAPGTVPNVSEARTAFAINSLEDRIAQNLPDLVPAVAGSNKFIVNFEGSGPVTDDRIGSDVNFALVNVGTNVRQGDGSSTQLFGMNNEGQYVQTFRIEGEQDLHSLKNVVEGMCVGYEIEIGVRDADGNVIDPSRRHNAGAEGVEGYAMHGPITDGGARRVANAKEGMASAVSVNLADLARDVLLSGDVRAEFLPSDPSAAAYAIGGDSLFLAAGHGASGTHDLGVLVLSDGERTAEYTLTANVGQTADRYVVGSHVGEDLTASQIADNRAINEFASTLGSLADSYGFRLGSEGPDAPVRSYSSPGELEGDLSRRGIHRIELDPQTGDVDLFYRLDPNNPDEPERVKQLIYTGEPGSFDHQMMVSNLYGSMGQQGLDYDHNALPNQLR